MAVRNLGIGVGCAALLFVFSVMASFAGASTCHEDLQSAAQAPHLCATAGNGVTLSISAVLGPGLIALMLLGSAKRRTLGWFTAWCLAAQVALLVMWALVSHGTIRY
jgi:hypothetical protein